MKTIIFYCSVVLFVLSASNACAQILNPKKLLERKATERANKAIDKKTDQVLDSVLEKKEDSKAQDQNTKKEENAEVKTRTETEVKQSLKEAPSLETYSKYDFIPGEKIIFFDDFSQDNVGDFPALWNTNGSAEVVTTNLYPGKWMKYYGRKTIWTDELLKLPDNYTIEFDIIPIKDEEGGMAGYDFRLIQSINPKAWDGGAVPGKAGFLFNIEYFGRPNYRTYINGDEGQGLGLSGHLDNKAYHQKENQKYHIALWIQKSRVRLYADENKIIDLPKAFPLASVKLDRIRFENGAAMISNIRIAVGAPDMRNKLMAEGKIVSYGIYFDVNKDVVKPQSYGSLKEIAAILTENPEIKIKIVGHTDADGADASNLDLSKRRAASVKNELVKSFGIDAARMESDGKGESQSVAANDTPANKALNRRVEFIKL